MTMKTIDGIVIDATISTTNDGSVTLHARGGGKSPINTEYAKGMLAILEILTHAGAHSIKVSVTSRSAMKLPAEKRSLLFNQSSLWPLPKLEDSSTNKEHLAKLDQRRRTMSKFIAKHGRMVGAKGSGNGTKRITISYDASLEIDWAQYQGGNDE